MKKIITIAAIGASLLPFAPAFALNANVEASAKIKADMDRPMRVTGEHREEMKENMKDRTHKRADFRNHRGVMFTAHLSFYANRLEAIANKIKTRANESDNASAETHADTALDNIADAKASIAKANSAIEAAFDTWNDVIDNEEKPEGSPMMELRADVKVDIKAAFDSIKSARVELKAAVEALKADKKEASDDNE